MDKAQAFTLRDWSSVEEVPELLDVWRSSVESRKDLLSASDIDAVANALELVYSEQVQVRIAEAAGRIIGFIAYSPEHIELIWVHHEYRMSGAGRALIFDVTARHPGLSVLVNPGNRSSLGFFSHHGFVPADNCLPDPLERVELRHAPAAEAGMAR